MKHRTHIVAFVFLLVMAFAAWQALRSEQPPSSLASTVPVVAAVSVAPASSGPLRPYADSPDAAAIDAAIAFLLRHEEQKRSSWQVYALLDYLQRRFGLGECYCVKQTFPREMWPEYDLSMAALFQRLTDNTFQLENVPPAGTPLDLNHFLAGALYCDQHPVDESFFQNMFETYRVDEARPAPGYAATHIILACQWLRELGCDRAFPELAAQWPVFADLLERIINRENAETDLAFESMMLLYYIGEGRRVWDAWVNTLRRLQHPSGAWGYAPDRDDHGHPTVLALWVLLENALPDVKKKPWVF